MAKHNNSFNAEKYINSVKKHLREKHGKINAEWLQPLQLLQDNLELYNQCRKEIETNGLLLVAKNGAMTKNPLIKVLFDAQIQIAKLLQEFGLTPKAASKINLVDDDDEELKDLLGD